jgi:hypothetical protein
LWREAHVEVKVEKADGYGALLDVQMSFLPGRRKGLRTLTCMFFSLRLLLQLLRVHVGSIGFTALGHPKPILPISCI